MLHAVIDRLFCLIITIAAIQLKGSVSLSYGAADDTSLR